MNIPATTKKQEQIIDLISQYRFLDRVQIQQFLNHKFRNRVNLWLKDLVAKEYIERIYTKKVGVNDPAVYYLALNGKRLLRNDNSIQRRLYRDKTVSQGFINKSLLLAKISLDLENHTGKNPTYKVTTKPDYSTPISTLNFLSGQENGVAPDLVIEKIEKNKQSIWYFLEILEETLPRYQVRKKVRSYFDLYLCNDWENHINSPFPIVLFGCPTKKVLTDAKRHARKLLEEEQSPNDLHIRFATVEDITQFGVTSKVWEEA